MLELRNPAAGTPTDGAVVTTGCSVKLLDLADLGEWEVTIVSSEEADPEADRISDCCPIGEALLGRRPGDLIRIEVPQGTVQYRVISVSPQRAPVPAHGYNPLGAYPAVASGKP